MIQTEKLSTHLHLFFRTLRDANFLVGPTEMTDALRALEWIEIADVGQFRLALKIVLCSSKEEQAVFDRLFQAFFLNNQRQQDMLHFLSEENKKDDLLVNESSATESDQVEQQETEQDATSEEYVTGEAIDDPAMSEVVGQQQSKVRLWTASNGMNQHAQEITTSVSAHQFQAMEKAAETFVHQVNRLQSRRYALMNQGKKFDLRKTLRQSVQTGGYPIQPIWVGPKKQKAKYILLCDSSRSMAAYADTFLQFAYALTKCTSHVEVFLFSTKLRKVTEQFTTCKQGEFPVLTVRGDEWGGGTCIGESLYSFVQQYGTYLVKKNTVVLIASDGLDAGKTDQLQWAMQEIHGRASSVIWLNPLLAIDGYEPIARGMKIALPYLDVFSEASHASAFQKLAKTITIRR